MDYENEMGFENRMVAPEYAPEDAEVENPLRPRTLEEYIGQEKVKENLAVFIEAAKQRKGIAGPCAAVRPAGARQDDAGGDHRQRIERQFAYHLRPSD